MTHGPPLVAWLLVALSTAAAAACVLRGQSRQEALTGAGMAAMAVPLSVVDPWRWAAPVLAAVYAYAVLSTLARPAAHTGHRTHHAVCSASMVYMALAMSGLGLGGGEHTGHSMDGGAGVPLLTGLLLLYFAGYVVRTGVRLVVVPFALPGGAAAPVALSAAAAGPAGSGAGDRDRDRDERIPGGAAQAAVPLRHSPEVAAACRVSMALAMFAMLVLL
ncbi:DUF5134 domain-containing protein [Streptomyces sp. V4-01]|uniref:DUF5134 domain-containing protein n=1 Tax=Actinacidiphila polyblastidii TaxID=3110430 RepID=A0ABU7PGH6_9ACTN|nr:DUF5134 domain-containing protein [Streptomyces sp. V4-01]